MSTADARAHLQKADEFLHAARSNFANGWHNAAASNSVSCGVNAKDAICLALTGRSGKSDRHIDAVKELRRAGPVGAELASTLSRLLGQKSKAQYEREDISAVEAEKAVMWAQRMYDGATRALA